jgi:hypothetical protein
MKREVKEVNKVFIHKKEAMDRVSMWWSTVGPYQ